MPRIYQKVGDEPYDVWQRLSRRHSPAPSTGRDGINRTQEPEMGIISTVHYWQMFCLQLCIQDFLCGFERGEIKIF